MDKVITEADLTKIKNIAEFLESYSKFGTELPASSRKLAQELRAVIINIEKVPSNNGSGQLT